MFSHLIRHSSEDDMYIIDVSEVDSVLDLLGEQNEEEKLGLTGTVWVEPHVNASISLPETDSFVIFESAIECEYSWIESSIQDHSGTSGPNLCAQLGNYGAGKEKCLSVKTARNYGFSF
ncbi:hypothetical protein DPMN_000357 [Dreissena polymorpha]|uniref:Uncharacterized protein n=1 Tax=Dreissena polymorpha TaxID=45954 RepID=A0A9D4RS03_DREPO|nr:hypothetical protein DPMN_000357 [Dreissena polymorpha]